LKTKGLREESRKTQEQVAKDAETWQDVVSKLERGKLPSAGLELLERVVLASGGQLVVEVMKSWVTPAVQPEQAKSPVLPATNFSCTVSVPEQEPEPKQEPVEPEYAADPEPVEADEAVDEPKYVPFDDEVPADQFDQRGKGGGRPKRK
jgi:transcriptional regulator with XRE-family HTH domain